MSQKLVNQKNRKTSAESESRTPLTDACEYVLKSLTKTEKPYSISSLARESNLHRKTVEKCVYLLLNIQKNWLDEYRLKVHDVDNKKIVQVEKRTGLLSYPDEVQNLVIKLRHFPHPSLETCQLLNLYLKHATTLHTSISEKNPLIEKLVKQGHIRKSDRGVYLSKSGITIARGVLKTYPELKYRNPDSRV